MGGAAFGSYFLNWWPSIGFFIRSGAKFAILTTNVPNWLFGLMSILSLLAVIISFVAVWIKMNPSESELEPDWRSYKSDIFFGLRWRWEYFDDGNIYDVYTFCPHCDFQVFPYNVSTFRMVDRISFSCDSCKQNLCEIDESLESLENKVRRLIQQKVRNGLWIQQNTA